MLRRLQQLFSQDPQGNLKEIIATDKRGWTHAPAVAICAYGVGSDAPSCPRAGEYVLWGNDLHVPLATACAEHLDAVRTRLEARYPQVDVEPFHSRTPQPAG